MSSLSLPRVLHQRKTSLELERENFEKFQAASISKAVNSIESPVKEKHVRIAIIGTFHDKSPELFWQLILKVPLQENRITAWKFCHVLHKVLRDGHPQTIPYSQKYRGKIADLGKLWCHLREGYGKLIQQYCQLLLVKLDFHQKNPGFPGNLLLSADELEKIGENDINNYFQMSVEMFDYMDEILSLQEYICGSLDMSRSNSMTSSGQCRLAPLIQCIQESSQLYDYCVRILFKLYAKLPADILSGHRARFLKQFHQLRQFYIFAANLQYFKNLIQIPLLPENPPNILVQAELRTYVAPVVIVPQEEPEAQITSDLIDVSSESSQNFNRSISPDLISQRDSLIDHLQNELSSTQTTVMQMRQRIISLEDKITEKREMLNKSQVEKAALAKQIEELVKNVDSEDKLKILEEKFNKLKEVYGKLREEHIQLIRQKAGIEKELKGSDKMTKFARAANNLIVSIKADVDKQLASVKNVDFEIAERTKLEEELATLQATADAAAEQNETLLCKVEWTMKEKSLVETKLQESIAGRSESEEKFRQIEKAILEQRNMIMDNCTRIIQWMMTVMNDVSFNSTSCSIDNLETVMEQISITIKRNPQDLVYITHLIATLMLLGRAFSNSMSDFDKSEKITNKLKELGHKTIEIVDQTKNGDCGFESVWLDVQDKITEIFKLIKSIDTNGMPESLSDLVETELATMDKAIEEATIRIEEMLKASKMADSGVKLEVNSKILDSCTDLMKTIRILVQKSKILQKEIVASGNASNKLSAREFYKRNHQWTEGLISAAKAVGMAAKYLLTAADEVVSSDGKLERLIVASQGVAASTAQLVVASRVKAERNSPNLSALSTASKDVTHATGNVVATVRSCAQMVEESENFDFSGLSLHQAKRLEMDSQVRVLELENSLEKERLKLAALRRYHYQLSEDIDES